MTWNSEDAITQGMQQYQQQYAEAVRMLQQVEQQRVAYEAQRNTIIGAIAALEQLLKNKAMEDAQTPQTPAVHTEPNPDLPSPEPAPEPIGS